MILAGCGRPAPWWGRPQRCCCFSRDTGEPRCRSRARGVRAEQPVRLVLDPARHLAVGRSTVRRVVLEAAVLGWVVRRYNDDPIRPTAGVVPVVGQDRVRHDRRGREAVSGVDLHVDAMRDEHLDRAAERRLGQRVLTCRLVCHSAVSPPAPRVRWDIPTHNGQKSADPSADSDEIPLASREPAHRRSCQCPSSRRSRQAPSGMCVGLP
jgi:hypothetical protein